jgi:hypothetical protein
MVIKIKALSIMHNAECALVRVASVFYAEKGGVVRHLRETAAFSGDFYYNERRELQIFCTKRHVV